MTKPRDYESYCRALSDSATKSLSDKVPSDQVFRENASHDADRMSRAGREAHPGSGQMTRQQHERQRAKSLSDQGILHGELYLDKEGRAHFICHTPGDMTFEEVKYALNLFIDLFLDQIERQEECPFHE